MAVIHSKAAVDCQWMLNHWKNMLELGRIAVTISNICTTVRFIYLQLHDLKKLRA